MIYLNASFQGFGPVKTSHRGDYYITAEFLIDSNRGIKVYQSFVPGRNPQKLPDLCRLLEGTTLPLDEITADSPPWLLEELVAQAFEGCRGKLVTLERKEHPAPREAGVRWLFSYQAVPPPATVEGADATVEASLAPTIINELCDLIGDESHPLVLAARELARRLT